MKTLKLIIRILIYLLAISVAPFTFIFWLCVWTPVWFILITSLNLIEFAFSSEGYEEFVDYRIIPWFFCLFVIWNMEKADKYI
jgi:hypothetical protein